MLFREWLKLKSNIPIYGEREAFKCCLKGLKPIRKHPMEIFFNYSNHSQ